MNYSKIYNLLIERGKHRIKIKGDFLHKHRIIPGFQKGKYISENISLLTRKEHRIVHKLRYKIYKNTNDLWAYYKLHSYISEKDLNLLNTLIAKKYLTKEKCSQGGKTQGNNNVVSGHCKKIAHLGGLIQGPKNKERLQELNKKQRKKVKVGEIIYNSQTDAGKDYNICAASVSDRIKSKHFPEWTYV